MSKPITISILCFALPLYIFLALQEAGGQTTYATLNGQVNDPGGAAVPGVLISIKAISTDFTQHTTTNGYGLYTINTLPPGQYTVTAEKDGFKKSVQAGLVLTVNQAATLNFTLSIGSVQQSVSVTANAVLINQTTADLSQVVNENSVAQLPLNGRNPSSLVFLAPGTTSITNTPEGYDPSSSSFPTETGASADGGRQGSTYYLLDGVQNMDTHILLAAPFPNADATQEFRIITNNFDASYGFSPGAVVNIQTKSGSNQLHGVLFEFLRNNDLNAGNYFTHLVDPLKRNQFGGSLGGPIKRDRLFFFANYQATRASEAAETNSSFTPTQAMLGGDFSAVPLQLRAPFATVGGKPNQVNPALFSPPAVAISHLVPLGAVAANGQVNFAQPGVVYTYNEATGRLDYTINNNQRAFLRSFIFFDDQPAESVNGNILSNSNGGTGRLYNELLDHTWTINPSLVNIADLAWLQIDYTSGAPVTNQQGQPVCLSQFINVNEPPGSCYVEDSISVTNGFTLPATTPTREDRNTWTIADSITKVTRGKHIFSGGIQALHEYANEISDYPTNPEVSFNGYVTGYGLADYLLGDASTFFQGAGETQTETGWSLGLYGQDQYRLLPNLTITAGLRWEPNLPPVVGAGRGAEFIPGRQSRRYPNAPLGMVFPGDPGVNASLMDKDYMVFAPRLGVAWQPRSLPRTVVRAAFGMFNAPLPNAQYNHTADISPFSPTYTLNASATNPISFANPWANFAATGGQSPFPPFASSKVAPPSTATFLAPTELSAIFSQGFKLGTTQSWNLSIEQQLSSDTALHMAYVGSQSYHQTTPMDLNPGIYASKGARSTYPLFGPIIAMADGGTASYHSLQVGLERRLSHNLQFTSNFTWSKDIDIASADGITFGVEIANPFDLGFNRGISSLNVPLISVTNFVYTSPKLSKMDPFLRSILGAWELSGIWTFQSGEPFGVSGGNGNNNSESQQDGDRANVTGQPYEVHQGGKQHWLQQYYNPAAFETNPPGTFGDSGKNILIGPGINTTDMGIDKNWQFADRYNLQFRWEMFNAFNRPTFGLPSANATSPNEGQITSIGAIPPRVMQGGIKFSF